MTDLPMMQRAVAWLAKRFGPPPAVAPAAGSVPAKRMYAGAQWDRKVSDWIAQSTSYDAELRTSLRALRNRSRQLVRDNEYAANAVRVIANNVVGQGVGLQAQVMMARGGRLNDGANQSIEAAWARWCRRAQCDVTGRLTFGELQRVIMRSIVTDGEVLIRKIPRAFRGSGVPFALEVIEADQLVEEWNGRSGGATGNEVRMGVEVDEWQSPVAYWLYPRHPGDFQFTAGAIQTNRLIRVPASEVLHLFVAPRVGATRGEPWLHSTLLRLNHMGQYEQSELIAARSSAAIMGFIKSPEVGDPTGETIAADEVESGQRVFDMEPGLIKELAPGESFEGWNPSRPNANADPFMRMMLRGVAAGLGVSYESLSRDYSQSNYSSSRLALLDDRDNWRVLQTWFVDHVMTDIFEPWLDAAIMSGAIPAAIAPDYLAAPERYQAVRWKTRGWDWVDPKKEVEAAKLAIRAGLQTVQGALAARGEDFEDVFAQRRRELDMADKLDLVLESNPAQVDDAGTLQPVGAPEGADGADTDAQASSGLPGGSANPDPDGDPADLPPADAARVLKLATRLR